MSNYCTHSDVGVLLQLTFSATKQPTDTQVTEIISQVTAEIDFHLKGSGVTIQPTDTTVLSLLKLNASKGAACIVGRTYFGNQTGVDGSQPMSYCTEYQDFLKMIDEKPELFGTITGDTTSILSNGVIIGSVSESSITDNLIDPSGWKN